MGTSARITGAHLLATQRAYNYARELQDRARQVKLVAFDVDGVLTDGGVHVGALGGQPIELKRFDIQDGLGIKFLQWSGLKVVIISGRRSEATALRAAELGVDACVQDDQAQKLKALEGLCSQWGLTPMQCAMVGDDWPDMAVLQAVGLPVAVANAVPEVRSAAVVRLDRAGGNGAVREFAEWLLRAQGTWDAVTAKYVTERGGTPRGTEPA